MKIYLFKVIYIKFANIYIIYRFKNINLLRVKGKIWDEEIPG